MQVGEKRFTQNQFHRVWCSTVRGEPQQGSGARREGGELDSLRATPGCDCCLVVGESPKGTTAVRTFDGGCRSVLHSTRGLGPMEHSLNFAHML